MFFFFFAFFRREGRGLRVGRERERENAIFKKYAVGFVDFLRFCAFFSFRGVEVSPDFGLCVWQPNERRGGDMERKEKEDDRRG